MGCSAALRRFGPTMPTAGGKRLEWLRVAWGPTLRGFKGQKGVTNTILKALQLNLTLAAAKMCAASASRTDIKKLLST